MDTLFFWFFNKTYGKKNLHNNPFDNYKDSNFFNVLFSFFYCISPFSLIIFIITNCYEIENIPAFSKFLKNSNVGHTSKKKLVIFRLINTFLQLVPTFFINDEYFLTVFSGITVVPLVGLIFPVF